MNGRRRTVATVLVVLGQIACAGVAARGAGAQRPALPATETGPVDWRRVDAAMGRAGVDAGGGVHRFNLPRSDLAVTSHGVRIRTALSLGSWVAFKARGPGRAVAMGDLVLTEAEYERVISRLQAGGVGQTAIHKHLQDESPRLWWTHVRAEGDPVRIAQTLRAALALTGTPASARGGEVKSRLELDTAAIDRELGRPGRSSGGVYHVSFPRAETIRAMGVEVPPAMGTASAISFQPLGGGKAAVNGDIVMTAGEVDGVLAALRAAHLQVVSLHNHMTDDEPRLFFTHFWAVGDAATLARGLKAALAHTRLAGG